MSLITLLFRILFAIILNKYFIICFIIWAIVCYFLVNNLFKNCEKYKNADKSLYEKYPEFLRHDWENWNFTKLYLGALFLLWIKLFLVLTTIVGAWLAVRYVTNGKKLEEKDEELTKKLKTIARVAGRSFLISCGIFTTHNYVDIDYEKYLGKNYKTSKDCAASICNHISWLDIMIMMGENGCGFITNIGVKNYHFIGTVCTWIGSIYVDRQSKESRSDSLSVLEKKLKDIYEKREFSSLCIFSEGTTSNGQYLLPFKKGAFTSFLPLQPNVVKIETKTSLSLAMDIIEITSHLLLVCCVPYHFVEVNKFPVFTPNEYFLKTYIPQNKSTENEEDWVVYSNVIRKIMMDSTNLKNGFNSFEGKTEVLSILRGNKKSDYK